MFRVVFFLAEILAGCVVGGLGGYIFYWMLMGIHYLDGIFGSPTSPFFLFVLMGAWGFLEGKSSSEQELVMADSIARIGFAFGTLWAVYLILSEQGETPQFPFLVATYLASIIFGFLFLDRRKKPASE